MADFFNRVKSGLDKGLNAVTVKSKEVLEVTKINGQIGGLKDQAAKLLRELGEMVYEMNLQGVLDQQEIQQKCDAVTALKQQIQEKETELQNVHMNAAVAMGQLFCPGCKNEVPEGTKFCGHCGTKLGGD
jgi:DNA repair exonuclease SbcCD ATPase subunit